LPGKVKARIAVEAGSGLGWDRYTGDSGRVIAINRFGASAPYKIIFEHLGLTVEHVLSEARSLLAKKSARGKK